MNVMTCTLITRRIFIVYCLVGYLCPDFAPISHDLGGCPDFYFSSLKTLVGQLIRDSAQVWDGCISVININRP